MILFLSDLHLGRGAPAEERALERDVIACLRHFEGRVRHLYLAGDVFDAYIEYRHLVPAGFVRLQALLAYWTGQGVPVTYVVGNHDPWHQRYFNEELGVRVVPDQVETTIAGRRLLVAHGDGLDPEEKLYNLLKPVLRHPLPVWAYTRLLPADAGMALARWVKRRVTDNGVHQHTIEALRRYAADQIRAGRADLVVLGHSHRAELSVLGGGAYLNTGYWREERTFGVLDGSAVQLLRWNGVRPVEVERYTFEAAPNHVPVG